jgi:D-alanine--poly(phosphoribitol) ligase subunit 1
MTQGNLESLINWGKMEFGFGPEEILTNLNPCYFDNFVFDFYLSIFTGAVIVPFLADEIKAPEILINKIIACKCTSWFSVPSLLIYLTTMKAFSNTAFKYLKRFIFGGEGYPKSKLQLLFDQYKDSIHFYNVYGPSECTCIASNYLVTELDFKNVNGFLPLGKLINGFSYYIINDDGGIVEKDELGELCLVGPAVGSGYFNNDQLTKQYFVSEAMITGDSGARVAYLTGDLVYLNSEDNKLYINGRKDNQIKHMGYRIELEEVESALFRQTYITEVCCIHKYENGFSKIIAYLSINEETPILKIKADLAKYIPNYMIPTELNFLDALPKNRNGKIDRNKLRNYSQPPKDLINGQSSIK